jgi:predicted O-linked N-acetylglucosamine transferase (SPINDLY family)
MIGGHVGDAKAVVPTGRTSGLSDAAEAQRARGASFRKEGDYAAALACYARALALEPNFVQGHLEFGNLLAEQRRLDEAVAHYRHVLILDPAHAWAHNNLANVLSEQGELAEALMHYNLAITHKPDYAEAYCNLGNALLKQGNVNAAAAQYIRALSLRPDLADAHYCLSTVFSRQGHLANAISACRRALQLNPDLLEASMQLAMLRMQACDWRHAETDVEQALALMHKHPGKTPPANLLCRPVSATDQLQCARQWAHELARWTPVRFQQSTPSLQRKIRLGYLCADYYTHPLARLIVEMIERHDRSRFCVTAYSIGPDDGSDFRRRLEAAFDQFVDLRAVEDFAAAKRIHADGIDILIDLTGYAQNARTRILVPRPAPIQVNGIGYTGTMGADFIDYIIVDPFVAPMDQQVFYAERLVHLPDCYQPSDGKRAISQQPIARIDYNLPVDGFVFCCFNNRYKLTPGFFDIWMRLLHAVPGSVLWLLEGWSIVQDNLRREAQQRGIDPMRLVFSSPVPQPEFLARLRLADLFLDTLPYNAHTTANDALWAGLPVLTCVGSTFAGRVAGSLLRALGLPELLTSSLEAYEGLALELAQHPNHLQQLREKLARNRTIMPLFDMARYTRAIEAAYMQMWEIWRRGEAPRAFATNEAPP